MRKILFRGKPTKDANVHNELKKQMVNGFVLGSLVTGNQPYIFGDITYDEKEDNAHLSWWIPVVAETVGQFTGLLDKHGRKIFEGDIVRIEDFANYAVKWREDIACWTLQDYIIGNTWGSSMLEVIGNIHDNPELLT